MNTYFILYFFFQQQLCKKHHDHDKCNMDCTSLLQLERLLGQDCCIHGQCDLLGYETPNLLTVENLGHIASG